MTIQLTSNEAIIVRIYLDVVAGKCTVRELKEAFYKLSDKFKENK